MKYRATLITARLLERPVTVYSESLKEARRWAGLFNLEDGDSVNIYETKEVLIETIIAAVPTDPPQSPPSAPDPADRLK